jgi:hypothetical protein
MSDRNSDKISFACLDHGLSENCGGTICPIIRNFENDFVMYRSDDPASGICQSLWEQCQRFLCDVC